MADAHDPDRASHESDASSSIALHLTETEQWDQEPFEQFRHKAEALCAQLWPVAGLLNIERIAGGGGNRIVAVDVAPVERKSKNTMKSIAGMKRIFEKLRILRRRQASPESSKRQAELPYGRFILRIPRTIDEPEESTLPNDEQHSDMRRRTSLSEPQISSRSN